MKRMGRQLLETAIFSIALSLIIWALSFLQGSDRFIHDQVWGILIFSALLGFLVAAIASWGMRSFDAQSRPNVFLGLTVLRMLLSMFFIGIVIFAGVDKKVLWVANFFGIYLFYLVFEILTILSNLRAISTEGEKP